MTKEELKLLLRPNKLVEAVTKGREAVQKLIPNYAPEGPHLEGTARTDASIFACKSWEGIVELIQKYGRHEFTIDDKESAIIIECRCYGVNPCGLPYDVPVGKTKTSKPTGDGPWHVVIGPHGPMAKGPAVVEEADTDLVTLIFTDEGEAGWCLASVHPGPAEEPGDYTNLKEGDELSKEDLDSRHITRVIPE